MASRRFRTVFPLLVAVALVGCQGPSSPVPPLSDRPTAQSTHGAHGTVTIDLTALRGAWGKRAVLSTEPAFATITQVRLTVLGPELTTSVSVTADWDGTPLEGTSGTPITSLTLEVPAGSNRVFVLEGLNADDEVLRVIRGVGPVVADQPLTLTLNYLTDAAGRTLEAIYAASSSLKTALEDTDVTAELLAFVDLHVGFDAAANEYDGVNPVRFDAAALATLLGTEGLTLLDGTTSRPALETPVSTTQIITVEDPDGNPVSAQVYLFSPTTGAALATDANGEAAFSAVAPGTWSVAAVAGDVVEWGSVTAGTADGGTTITLTPPTPGVTTLTLTGESLGYSSYNVGFTADAAGNLYVADLNNYTIKKITPAGAVSVYAGTGTAVDDVAVASGAADSSTSRLAASFFYVTSLAAAPNGALYVNDARMLRKITTSGVTTLDANPAKSGKEDFGNLKCVAVRSDGTVYVLGNSGGIPTVFTLDANDAIAEQVALTWPTGTVFGPDFNPIAMAVASDGTVYITHRPISGNQGCVVKVNGGNLEPVTAADAFHSVEGLTLLDDTHALVTDTLGHVIRAVDLTTGTVTTVAGMPDVNNAETLDGSLTAARFGYSAGIVAATSGIFVTDASSIRKIVR